MDWRIVGINFLYAGLGVVLMYMSYRLIDILTPQVNFPDELKRGNIAVAIFIGALFISIAQKAVAPQKKIVRCHGCGVDRHDQDAKFCKGCGKGLAEAPPSDV